MFLHVFTIAICGEDISNVLNMIGVHPAGVNEQIERPVAENAMVFFNALAEFAYDMDSQQVFRPMETPLKRLFWASTWPFLKVFNGF